MQIKLTQAFQRLQERLDREQRKAFALEPNPPAVRPTYRARAVEIRDALHQAFPRRLRPQDAFRTFERLDAVSQHHLVQAVPDTLGRWWDLATRDLVITEAYQLVVEEIEKTEDQSLLLSAAVHRRYSAVGLVLMTEKPELVALFSGGA